jgi:hypothetical protein
LPRSGARGDGVDVGCAQALIDLEPDQGGLDRHVGVDVLLGDPLQEPGVVVNRGLRLGPLDHLLAEHIDGGHCAFGVEDADRRHSIVE